MENYKINFDGADIENTYQTLKKWLNERAKTSGGNVENTISDEFLRHIVMISRIYKPYEEEPRKAVDDLSAVVTYCEMKEVPISKEVLSEVYKIVFNIQIYNN
ncbi:hypothetical protein [Staphylococcus pettenkoferi]|uniref:hypothetical protein n=1 Tax=Staphylococcus pettenkoferi TaxID=170573 RepID=UPI002553CE36|nr:hypothetical protein [Staphylococcus pettenkoferi]MDK7284453.1 hypothetical protein [Staphylococcus pettenkoferi]